MNLPRRAAVLGFAAVLMLSWAPGLGAQQKENETFGIAPSPNEVDSQTRGSFAIPLERGSTWEDALRIYNRTNETITLVIYATDAEDTESVIETGLRTSRPKGVGAWIDLARNSVELKPKDEQIVTFRVEVTDSDPSPDLGAIVVENTASGTARNAQREYLLVRTAPPNTETTSMRVRPLLLRSPWIIVAMLGLVVAIGLVWVGARRANRPKDVVVPAGEFDDDDEEDVQEASRPVIKRLGATTTSTAVLERHAPRSPDDRPLLDDALLVEVDPDEDEDEPIDELEDDEDDEDFDHEVSASNDDFDEDDDLDGDEEDLPPARQAPRPRASTSRVSTNGQRKPAAKKKPAARRKPAARKATRKASPKKKVVAKQAAPKRGYIPLNDL